MYRAGLFKQEQTAFGAGQIAQELHRRYNDEGQNGREQYRRKIEPHI